MVLMATIILGCTKNSEVISPEDGRLYGKLEVGQIRIYQAVKKTYLVGPKLVIDSFLVRETIQSVVQNTDGSMAYQTLREVKRKNDFQYTANLQYIQTTSPKELVSTEQNIPRVLLRYPLNYGAEWNINEQNNLDENKVFLLKPNETILAKFANKKDLLMIEIDDFDDDLTSKNLQLMVFSKTEGLIYNENTQLEYCYINEERVRPCDPNKKIISSGFDEQKTLIEFIPAPSL
jgi:hypothetical protein